LIGTTLRRVSLAACLCLSACSEEPQPETELLLPDASVANLLLICIDTVRADVFYGMGDGRKDAFTAWENRALRFDRAISSSSWTVPALGSVFSGLWQSGHGAGQLPMISVEAKAAKPTALYADVPLLTEAAEKAGFQTAVISASPWTNTLGDPMGLNKGFVEKVNIGMNGATRTFSKMREILASKDADARFFHYVHLMEAHDWHMLPEATLDSRIENMSDAERALYLDVAPPTACQEESSLLCKRYLVYASAVYRLRSALAALFADMRSGGLLDDTVVVLFADHGEEFGDHDNDGRLVKTVEGVPDRFVGHGQSMYQELLHVPLLVWHPRYPGAVIDDMVSLVDIGPTIARWLEIPFRPEAWPGHYLDEYLDPTPEALDRVAYASGISVGQQQMSALQGWNKSVWYMASDDYDYFDLETDPREMNSQAEDRLVMLFDGLFLDYTQNKRQEELMPASLSAEQIKRLQAIGYLQGVEVESAGVESIGGLRADPESSDVDGAGELGLNGE